MEVAYCKVSHRVTTVALSLSIGAGLKKIEPFMKAWGQFYREFPGIQNTQIVHFYLEGFIAF
jgi:hypothetical protein